MDFLQLGRTAARIGANPSLIDNLTDEERAALGLPPRTAANPIKPVSFSRVPPQDSPQDDGLTEEERDALLRGSLSLPAPPKPKPIVDLTNTLYGSPIDRIDPQSLQEISSTKFGKPVSPGAMAVMTGDYAGIKPTPESKALADEVATHGAMMHGGLSPQGYAGTFASRSGVNLDDPEAMAGLLANSGGLPSIPFNAQSRDYGMQPMVSGTVAGITMPKGGPLRPDDRMDVLGHYIGSPSTTPEQQAAQDKLAADLMAKIKNNSSYRNAAGRLNAPKSPDELVAGTNKALQYGVDSRARQQAQKDKAHALVVAEAQGEAVGRMLRTKGLDAATQLLLAQMGQQGGKPDLNDPRVRALNPALAAQQEEHDKNQSIIGLNNANAQAITASAGSAAMRAWADAKQQARESDMKLMGILMRRHDPNAYISKEDRDYEANWNPQYDAAHPPPQLGATGIAGNPATSGPGVSVVGAHAPTPPQTPAKPSLMDAIAGAENEAKNPVIKEFNLATAAPEQIGQFIEDRLKNETLDHDTLDAIRRLALDKARAEPDIYAMPKDRNPDKPNRGPGGGGPAIDMRLRNYYWLLNAPEGVDLLAHLMIKRKKFAEQPSGPPTGINYQRNF